jgi:CBS domain-containing protein
MTVDTEARVEAVMERDPPVAHLHESLSRARSRVRASGKRTVAVVDGDRIAAVLSAAALETRCATAADCERVHLRDRCGPPVPFCYAEDHLATARSALTLAAAEGTNGGAVAVVDAQRRLVGVIEAECLGDAPPGGPARAPEDPTDTRHLESPKLTVYAAWATLAS